MFYCRDGQGPDACPEVQHLPGQDFCAYQAVCGRLHHSQDLLHSQRKRPHSETELCLWVRVCARRLMVGITVDTLGVRTFAFKLHDYRELGVHCEYDIQLGRW